uniref:G_PROTEIN_RECEP_F1_2 domain-containing protein n=1 Tax=Panagrellus redivivus TaxID=6233 RepID=A0A7E4VGP6_PANRE
MSNICVQSALIGNHAWININSVAGIFVSLGTLVVQMLLFTYVRHNRVYCHTNFKLISLSFCLFFMLNAIFGAVMQTFNQFQWRFGTCSAVLQRWQCLMFRAPQLVAMIGFSLNHVLLFVDRAFATWNPKKYEQQSPIVGVMAVSIIWSIAILTMVLMTSDNDMSVKYAYCMVSVEKTGPRMLTVCFVLAVIDSLALLGDGILKWLCRQQDKNRNLKISPGRYILGEQVQIIENQITTTALFPFAVLHVTMFFVFLVATTMYRYLNTTATLTPDVISHLEIMHLLVFIYVLAANILNLLTYRQLFLTREKSRTDAGIKNHTDAYFRMFEQQIH